MLRARRRGRGRRETWSERAPGRRHAPPMRQSLVEVGVSVASSALMTPPLAVADDRLARRRGLQARIRRPWSARGRRTRRWYRSRSRHTPGWQQSSWRRNSGRSRWCHSGRSCTSLPLQTAPFALWARTCRFTQYESDDWQSASVVHMVRKAVAFAHLKPPAQGAKVCPRAAAGTVADGWRRQHAVRARRSSHQMLDLFGYTQAPVSSHAVALHGTPTVHAELRALLVPFKPQTRRSRIGRCPCKSSRSLGACTSCCLRRSAAQAVIRCPAAVIVRAALVPGRHTSRLRSPVSVSTPFLMPSLHDMQVPGVPPAQSLLAQSLLAAQ